MDNQTNEWVFENESDKLLGIETLAGENGNKLKRATLSDGRVAVVERLKAKDVKAIQRQMAGNPENFQQSVIAASLKVNGEKVVVEELDEIWMNDYTVILAMAEINFPSTPNA